MVASFLEECLYLQGLSELTWEREGIGYTGEVRKGGQEEWPITARDGGEETVPGQ